MVGRRARLATTEEENEPPCLRIATYVCGGFAALLILLMAMSSNSTTVIPEETISSNEFHVYEYAYKYDRPRVILFSGLHGSGEAMFRQMLSRVCGTEIKCAPLCAVSNPDYLYSISPTKFLEARESAKQELRGLNRDTVYVGSLYGSMCRHQDEVSFPSASDWTNSLLHPDILDLHNLMVEFNIDFRLLVPMTHNVQSIAEDWLSDPVYRKKTLRVMQTLEVQLHALYATLVQLPNESYRIYDVDANKIVGAETLDEWLFCTGADAFIKKNLNVWKHEAFPRLESTPELEDMIEDFQVGLDQLWTLAQPSQGGPRKILLQKEATGREVMFWAGLEGTGHHLWYSVNRKLIKSHRHAFSCGTSGALYWDTTGNSMWHADTLSHYNASRVKFKNHLQELNLERDGLLNSLNCVGCQQTGMMSYPNFGGRYKNVQRPNLISIARVAESQDVRLKVVILTRNVDSVLSSTIDNRNFAREGTEIRTLTSNAMGLLATLDALEEGFIVSCIDFDDHELNYISSITKAYGGGDEIEDVIRSTVKFNATFSAKGKAKEPNEQRHALSESLRATVRTIERRFCNKTESVHRDMNQRK